MTDISKASHGDSPVPPSSEPRLPSAPLMPAPPGEMSGNVSKFSVWPFRKSSHNKNKSRNTSSPLLERSKSEPNSPTEPTMVAARSNNKEGDRPNYIIMARDLLNDTKLRFEGHKKEWSEFYDRYNQLFANGQPIYGKIVKQNTPKPNAQDVAKFLINDIKAVLEDLDKEELMGQFKGKIRTMRVTETAPTLPSEHPSRPWFDPSIVNPAVLEKTERHRSINPEGTWHSHSRSRQFTPNFSTYQNRNRIMTRSDPQTPPSGSQRELRLAITDRRHGDSEGSDVDEWELARINMPREMGVLGPMPSNSIQHIEEIRNDRRHQSHDNIHRIYHPRPEYASRERLTPDSAPTPPPPLVPQSPESMNPSLYQLPESDSLGESSTSVAKNTTIGAGIQRPPTFIMYPGLEEPRAPVENERWVPPASAPPQISTGSARMPDGPMGGSGTYSGERSRKRSMSLDHQLRERAIYKSQSRVDSSRDRQRDLRDKEREYLERGSGRERDGHRSEKERDGYRPDREKDGYRSGRDRDRDRDRDKDRERDWEHRLRDREHREKGIEREGERDQEKGKERERERDQDKTRGAEEDRDKWKDKDGHRDKDHPRERTRDGYRDRYRDEERYRDGDRYGDRYRERDRDRDRDRNKDKDRDRDRERNRDRDRDRDRDREKDRDRDREKEKERNRDREKNRHGNTRNKYDELERDIGDPRASRDRERDKDNARDRERDREREYRDKFSEKERRKERERDRDRDKEGDRNKRLDPDHNRRDRQAAGPSSPPLTVQPTPGPNIMPGALGSVSPRKPKPSLTPPSLPGHLIPSAAYTPRTAHTMLKYDAARDAVRPPNPNSSSRFLEILTSPVPPMNSNLPGV